MALIPESYECKKTCKQNVRSADLTEHNFEIYCSFVSLLINQNDIHYNPDLPDLSFI